MTGDTAVKHKNTKRPKRLRRRYSHPPQTNGQDMGLNSNVCTPQTIDKTSGDRSGTPISDAHHARYAYQRRGVIGAARLSATHIMLRYAYQRRKSYSGTPIIDVGENEHAELASMHRVQSPPDF